MNKPDYIRNIKNIDVSLYQSFLKNKNFNFEGKFNKKYNRDINFKNCTSCSIVERLFIKNVRLHNSFLNISQDLLLTLFEYFGPGKISNLQIANLLNGGEILSHSDEGLFFAFSHRIHIPVQTNDQVIFSIEDKKFNFKEGEVVEINNLRNHSVVNNNTEYHERIHIILDYMPIEYINFLVEPETKKFLYQ